jgi:hypothetical protein
LGIAASGAVDDDSARAGTVLRRKFAATMESELALSATGNRRPMVILSSSVLSAMR